MSTLWAMAIVAGISIFVVISLSKVGLFPLYETTILKRCFTFGELAVVAQALTLLAMELWVISVNKLVLLKNPYF
ncbi:11886_t:CDS:2, partial [Acaulospora morrowiae]